MNPQDKMYVATGVSDGPPAHRIVIVAEHEYTMDEALKLYQCIGAAIGVEMLAHALYEARKSVGDECLRVLAKTIDDWKRGVLP